MRFGTPATRLTTTGSAFGAVYAGATNFTYKIRTNTATGTGAITLHVISDFGPANESCVAGGDPFTCTRTIFLQFREKKPESKAPLK